MRTQIVVAYAMPSKVDKLVVALQQLDKQLSGYSSNLLKRCAQRSLSGSGSSSMVLPKSWPPDLGFAWRAQQPAAAAAASDGDEAARQQQLAAAAAAADTQQTLRLFSLRGHLAAQLLAAAPGAPIHIPFDLTPDQQQLLEFPHSCLAVGRSGTGKTTVLEAKVFQLELVGQQAGAQQPRQLLVTASDRLALALQQELNHKMQALKDQQARAAAAIDAAAGHQAEDFAEEEVEAGAAGAAAAAGGGREEDGMLLDDYAVRQRQKQLPASWSQVSTEHLPLAITYAHLLSLLDSELPVRFEQWFKQRQDQHAAAAGTGPGDAVADPDDIGPEGEEGGGEAAGPREEGDLFDFLQQQPGSSAAGTSAGVNHRTGASSHATAAPAAGGGGTTSGTSSSSAVKWVPYLQVDFALFDQQYWPRMNQVLRKGISAALVYAEVMGVIKGSVEALVSRVAPVGHLSEQAYLALAEQRTSSLTVPQRQVYALYRQYEHLKGQAWQYDHMDRVLYVYRQLAAADAKGQPVVGSCQQVDRVYVDEVQDLSMAQLYLLR